LGRGSYAMPNVRDAFHCAFRRLNARLKGDRSVASFPNETMLQMVVCVPKELETNRQSCISKWRYFKESQELYPPILQPPLYNCKGDVDPMIKPSCQIHPTTRHVIHNAPFNAFNRFDNYLPTYIPIHKKKHHVRHHANRDIQSRGGSESRSGSASSRLEPHVKNLDDVSSRRGNEYRTTSDKVNRNSLCRKSGMRQPLNDSTIKLSVTSTRSFEGNHSR